MKDNGLVYGSKAQAVPLIVGKDTVYVHTNIKQILEDNEGNKTNNLFSYDEKQYSKDEYIAFLSNNLERLKEEDISNKMAIVELFEMTI